MDDLISMCNLHHGKKKKAEDKRRKACHGEHKQQKKHKQQKITKVNKSVISKYEVSLALGVNFNNI